MQVQQEAIHRLAQELSSIQTDNISSEQQTIEREFAKIDAEREEKLSVILDRYHSQCVALQKDKEVKFEHLRSARDKIVTDRANFDNEYQQRIADISLKADAHKTNMSVAHDEWSGGIHKDIQLHTVRTDEQIEALRASQIAHQQEIER